MSKFVSILLLCIFITLIFGVGVGFYLYYSDSPIDVYIVVVVSLLFGLLLGMIAIYADKKSLMIIKKRNIKINKYIAIIVLLIAAISIFMIINQL